MPGSALPACRSADRPEGSDSAHYGLAGDVGDRAPCRRRRGHHGWRAMRCQVPAWTAGPCRTGPLSASATSACRTRPGGGVVSHIHVRYQGSEAVVSIPDGSLLEGGIPKAKIKLVDAWIELHRDELMANWELTASGQHPFNIEPLR